MSSLDWADSEDKQKAAMAFLKAVSLRDDPASEALREAVLSDRERAREIFAEKGDIDIPADVEVICLPNDTAKLDKLIVFILPDDAREVTRIEDVLEKFWVAAWRAYGPT